MMDVSNGMLVSDYSTSRSRSRSRILAPSRTPTATRSRSKIPFAPPTAGAPKVLCAINESKSISPVVGICFIIFQTAELIISTIQDSQTYVRTVHKLQVYEPTEILVPANMIETGSSLLSIVRSSINMSQTRITGTSKSYYNSNGHDPLALIQQYAFADEFVKLKLQLINQTLALTACNAIITYFQAKQKYNSYNFKRFRVKYQGCENTMLIDASTIKSLELIDSNVSDQGGDGLTLFKFLNRTVTKMGARVLRNNILQPLTDKNSIRLRLESVQELIGRQYALNDIRKALKNVQDLDKLFILLISKPARTETGQKINNILLWKESVTMAARISTMISENQLNSTLLQEIKSLCHSADIEQVSKLIDEYVNEDCRWTNKPLELRNQKCYAIKEKKNGLLDISRQLHTKIIDEIMNAIGRLGEEHNLILTHYYDSTKGFSIKINRKLNNDVDINDLPVVFINKSTKKAHIHCTTLELLKLNRRLSDTLAEIFLLCDQTIDELNGKIEVYTSGLFIMSEALSILDLLATFSYVALNSVRTYTCPELHDKLILKSSRHPILEKILGFKNFVANDIYSLKETSRVNIITGANMSGKSVYLKQIALIVILGQIGCFVPADYAVLPVYQKLMARIRTDNLDVFNASTFSLEMSEMAYILQELENNNDEESLIIIDELGRGSSITDGFSIALAITQHLLNECQNCSVFFATHFQDIPNVLKNSLSLLELHMSYEEVDNVKFKVMQGTSNIKGYGIQLAKDNNLFIDEIIEAANTYSTTLVSRQTKSRRDHKTITREVRILKKRRLMVDLLIALQHFHKKLESQEIVDPKTAIVTLRTLQENFVERMVEVGPSAASGGLADRTVEAEAEKAEQETPGATSAPSPQFDNLHKKGA